MLASRRIEGFRFGDIACFYRVGKRFGAGNQRGGFGAHPGFVLGHSAFQRHQIALRRRFFTTGGLDDKLAFRVAQQAAGHVIFTRLQVSGHLLAKAWRDVFALFDDHHAFKDFPLQRLLAVVQDDELGFTGVHRERHRLALFVVYGDFHLRNIRRAGGKGGADKRQQRHGKRATAKLIRHDHPSKSML